jgi:hypothetical protein
MRAAGGGSRSRAGLRGGRGRGKAVAAGGAPPVHLKDPVETPVEFKGAF